MRLFRFGVQLSKAHDPEEWRAIARKVEDLGYSSLHVPDHLDSQWGPVVSATVAAEATEQLNVGLLVLDNDFRHPVVLAKELATLDLFSEGRLEVGLGAGWMKSDYSTSGIALDPASTRVARLAESIAIMKDLWRHGYCDYLGDHYEVRAATGFPEPHRKPYPLLAVGGGSPRVLALAAREADIVGINARLAEGVIGPEVVASARSDKFDQRVMWVKEAAGDRFDQLEIQCLTFFVNVGPGGGELLEKMAPAFGLSPEQAAEAPPVLVGTVDDVCETLQARRARYGFNYFVVHESELDSFAPVVARLTGT